MLTKTSCLASLLRAGKLRLPGPLNKASGPMTYRIISIAPAHIASFREAADAVVRESQMFAFLEAPPLEQFTEFVHGVIKNKEPQFVAITAERVIGWCDVLMKPRPAMRHSGALGLLDSYLMSLLYDQPNN